jgi:hypothetical protein
MFIMTVKTDVDYQAQRNDDANIYFVWLSEYVIKKSSAHMKRTVSLIKVKSCNAALSTLLVSIHS